jgi:hypothetical protein
MRSWSVAFAVRPEVKRTRINKRRVLVRIA